MRTRFLLLYIACSLAASLCLAQAPDHEVQMSTREIKRLIDSLEKTMDRSYLYRDRAIVMMSDVKRLFKKGAYNSIGNKAELCRRLQTDMQLSYKDSHLEIIYNPQLANSLETYIPDTAASRMAYERDLHAAQESNFAFKKAELLQGNIGYLRWDGFFGFIDEAKPTVDGAFRFISNAKALIIDMRNNTGGSPEMVLQMQSYFFNQRTAMNHIIGRNNDTLMRWAEPRRTDFKLNMPVYILAGRSTFSGAEDFCYGLKHAGRAIIVGDTTRGGAHVTRPFNIGQGFVAFIPGQRAFNVATQTDWDGTGVWPDVVAQSDQALLQAQSLIYEELISHTADTHEQKVLRWLLSNNSNKILLARQQLTDSIQLTKQESSAYCGEYLTSDSNNPIRSIFIVLRGSRIFRHLDNGTEDILLIPVAPGKFVYDDDSGRSIEFATGATNGSLNMILETPNGTVTRTRKS